MDTLLWPDLLARLVNDPAVQLAAAAAAALVFACTAWAKLREPEVFVAQLDAYALLPAALVTPVGRALPWALLIGSLAIVWPPVRVPAAWLLLALNGLFTLAIAVNLARGHDQIDCGCSLATSVLDRQAMRLRPALLWRNAWLTLLLAPALSGAGGRALTAADLPGVLAGSLALAALYLLIDVSLHHQALLQKTGPFVSRGSP